jgi:hypothetical protein
MSTAAQFTRTYLNVAAAGSCDDTGGFSVRTLLQALKNMVDAQLTRKLKGSCGAASSSAASAEPAVQCGCVLGGKMHTCK